MKNIIIAFLLLSGSCFAQPNRSRIDSVTLEKDTLFVYYNGNKTAKGTVSVKVDGNRSLSVGINPLASGVGSVALNANTRVPGHNSLAANQNTVVEANGAAGFGADGRLHPTAHYGFIANDANEGWGVSSSTFGFGNDNYDENGVVIGSDNDAGTTPNLNRSSFTGGERSASDGTRSFTFGRVARTKGADITLFGTGVRGTLTPIVANIPESFNVGYNSTVPTLTVLPANGPGTYGKIVLNGVPYNFPLTQGAPGSVLVNDGNGNLSWSAPAQPKTITTTLTTQPKAIAVYNSIGQLLYVQKIY